MVLNSTKSVSRAVVAGAVILSIGVGSTAAPTKTETPPKLSITASDTPFPASLAGTIPPAKGRIAYIKSGDVYAINVDGTNGEVLCKAGNASGRLSWAPGNKEIVFARQGQVDVKNPDGLGGKHKIYDLFKIIIDSVKVNKGWWERVTENLGSRAPEWSRDGKRIYFMKDLNADQVTALFPEYQIASIDPSGGSLAHLRPDYQQADYMSMYPTAGPGGMIAYGVFYDKKPQGIVIHDPAKPFETLKDLITGSPELRLAIMPSWSPDGQWIAYINNDVNRNGLYVVSPDRSKKYLIYRPQTGKAISGSAAGWSPDSKWVTFAMDDGAIWICDITGKQAKMLVGAGDNNSPAWSR